MSEPITTQLGQFSATGTGTPRVGQAGDHTFSATVTGPAAVAATVLIEGSNDNLGWTTLATLTLSGTASASASTAATSSYAYWRATVSALTGTGVVVSVATEQATDAAQLTSLQKSRLLAILPSTEALVSGAGNDGSLLTIGGDHPYDQWWGTNGKNGMAAMYLDRGIQPYLAVCWDDSVDNTSGVGATLGRDNQGMMSLDQALKLQEWGVQFVSHGARHTHYWETFNTGIRVRYTGTNTQPTVHITGGVMTLATTSPATSVAITLASHPTVNDLVAAIAALDGTPNLNGTWRCIPATELTGLESTENLLPLQAPRRNDAAFYPGESRLSGQCFALSGGLLLRYTGTAYKEVAVTCNDTSNNLGIYADGARLLSTTTNASLATIAAAVNALNLAGLTCLVMDNGRSAQSIGGSTAVNPGQSIRETYCFGDENGLGLRRNDFTIVSYFGTHLDMGVGFAYAVRRSIEAVKERAAAAGITLHGFAQSGGRFYPWLLRSMGDEHEFWRGDRSYMEGSGGLSPHAMPANKTPLHTGHFTSRSPSSSLPYGEDDVKAIIDALADNKGWAACWLNHLLTPTPADKSGYEVTTQIEYSDADQDEGPFNRQLAHAAAARDAGLIRIVGPSDFNRLRHASRGPANLVFNPKFRNGRANNLLGITSALNGASGVAMPGWKIASDAADWTAFSVDASTRELTLTSNGVLAANKTPLGFNLYLEPGKTYMIGASLDLRQWGTGLSRNVRFNLYPLHTGFGDPVAQGEAALASYGWSGQFQGDASFMFTVPVAEPMSPARIISPAGPFTITAGHTITVSVDALAASAPITLGGLTTAKQIAAAINTAMASDATYGPLTRYHDIARAEGERLVIEAPQIKVTAETTGSQMTLANGTGTPLASVFGAGVTTCRAVSRIHARPDSALIGYFVVLVPSATDATRTLRIRAPYCREVNL